MKFTRVPLVILLMVGACSAPDKVEDRPPNIVFIVADDLGWTDLGSYGSGFYQTPNIDSLARDGTRFTSAYANPNCAPTRAALMTGRYSPRTGVYTVASGARGLEEFRRMIPVENVTDLPLAEVTFAELFQSAGYVTAHMGKWHLGTDALAPTGQGFDLNVGGNQTGGPRGGYFSPYRNPQLPDGPEGEHLTGRLAAEAVSCIESNRDRPFLLYLPFYAVHSPIQARPELIARYEGRKPVRGQHQPVYAAMVQSLDEAVGQVLEALDELGLRDRTAVFFYSDNGGVGGYAEAGVDVPPAASQGKMYPWDTTTNRPLRGGKGMLYEGGVRVPLMVRYPPLIPADTLQSEPVGSADFFPTLLEVAGIKVPPHLEIDGTSFMDQLQGRESGSDRPPLYWHFPGYLPARSNIGSWRTTPAGAIRVGDFKLIEFFETGEIELYNLAQDIGEQNNLAASQPEKAAELHGQLRTWREALGAPMPLKKP